MSDSLFRQKPSTSIPSGVENTAEDATPSPQSGARIGTPVWRQFVADEDFQRENAAPVRAEMAQQRAESRPSRELWKGANGKLLRKAGGIFEMLNAEDFVDHPQAGFEARKSIWDRDKREAVAEHQAASLLLQDPAFKAQELSKKDREAFEAEGAILQESDPRHAELKSKLVADTDYQTRKSELERKAYDAKVRAFQIEQTDPDTHWVNRQSPTPTQLRTEQVQAHQDERAKAEAADQSAVEEEKALDAELVAGVTGARSLEIKARKAEIAQARQMVGEKKAAADSGIAGVATQAKEEVDKPFFGFSDAFSGIWDALKGLGTTAPAAFYQLTEGLERPDKYSDSAKAAFAEADAFTKEMQAKNAVSGSTDVGSAFRDAAGSLGFSLGSMAAAIPASMAGAKAGAAAGGAIGAAVGAPAAGAGAAPGAAVGASIGGTVGGVSAGMAASATAAYRMAGASFLNEAFQTINAESMAKNGRPMNEQEMASAYENLLPIAQNTALWEAGPEAVGNAVTMGAGKIIFGLGKPLMARFMANTAGKVATKAGAAAASLGTELAGETITQVEQSADQEKMQTIAQGQDPNAIVADWSAGGVVEAFKEVAPQTLAMMALMGGAGGVMKAGSMAVDRMKNDPNVAEESPETVLEAVATELAAIDPEAAPPTADEMALASMIAPDATADGVLIERELAAVEAEDAETMAAAERQMDFARQSGDKTAIKAAQDEMDAYKQRTNRAPAVRAVLKIAGGQQLDDLTSAELASIGFKDSGDSFAPMTAKELKDAGISSPLIRQGADGSIIITDGALKKVGEISPRARGRVKMTEAEAIQKAKQRFSTDTQNGGQGDPATGSLTSPLETNASVEFDVPMRDGTTLRVQAADGAAALEEAAAVAPISGQPATPVSNEPNPQETVSEPAAVAPVPVSEVPTPANGKKDGGASGGKPAGTGSAKAKAEAPVGLSDRRRFSQDDNSMEAKVHAAIHATQGADKRFDGLRKRGATDAELVEAISDAFGTYTGSSQFGGWTAKGGKSPNLEAYGLGDGKPPRSIKGKELVAMVRSLMQIPNPVDVQKTASGETQTPKASTGEQQPDKAARAAVRNRFAKAKKKLGDRLIEGAERATTRPEGITINPKQIIDEALSRGMSEKDAAEYFSRVLDEEIRHLAQYDAGKILYRAEKATEPFLEWMESHYAAIWQSDFAGEKGDIVRDIYAKTETGVSVAWDKMSDGDKALEAIRMMSQGDAITEQGKLWADISEGLKKAIRAALLALKQFSDIASPTLKTEIENLENALKSLTESQPRGGNSKTGGRKPAAVETGDGTRGKAESERPGGTPVDGGAESAPSAVAGSPLVVGARVSFVRGGVAGTGVISYNPGQGALRVRPDSDPKISFAMRDGDVTVIEPPKVHGEKINGEWTAFAPESGTIGIPRAMMPQIKAGDRSALVQFLKARGVSYRDETVPASSLKPTQTEYSPAKVAKAKAFKGGNRSILISSDNHVLDGHHQWMAALENGEEIPVIRLDAPIRKLLPLAMQMPSATVDGGEILDAPPANSTEAPAPVTSEAVVESKADSEEQGAAADLSYDNLVRATYAGADARRKFDDLRPVMQQYVMDFHASGIERTPTKAKKWLASKGVVGNVGSDVVEILKNLKLADSIAAEKQAIVELNRRENEAKKPSNPQKSPKSNVASPAKPKRAKHDTPARRRAMELVYSDSTLIPTIVKIIEQGGKLTPPPAGMLRIAEKQSKARNLTNRQIAERRKWQDYNAYQPKYAFGSNFNGKVAQELHGMLFTSGPTTSKLDDWAGILGGLTNDEAMREVMAELERVAKGRLADNENPLNRELTAEEERQVMAFDEVNQFDFGRSDLFPQDMEVGETILMGGETFTLIAKRDGMATLEDGKKFGTQRVPVDSSLWFDMDNSPFSPEEEAEAEDLVDESEKQGYESADEFNESDPESVDEILGSGPTEEISDSSSVPDDRGAPENGQGQGGVRQSQVKPPASKMDVKNADSRELFSDDGGFSLVADTTQDGDKIAAERKAKEDAKAAMDAAQGDIFAAPSGPTTKPEIPDLPIRAAEMVADFERAKIISDLDAKALGEGAREQGWGKPQSPSTVEKVKNAAKENGWEWNDVLDKVKAQLKLNDDFGKDGDEAQKHIDARRKFETDWEKNHPGWKPAPAKPALSAGKQALKDAFSDMVDGLKTAPLTDAGFYSSNGIPREKRAVFMDVADKLYDEGIRTPDALAAALEEVGGGKLRAYSDAVWSVLRSNYPELPQAGDWAGIYSKISDPTSNDSSSGTSLEPDRGNAGSPDASGQGGVRDGRGATRGNGKRVVSDGNRSGNASPDHLQSDDVPSASERVGSDQQSPEPSPELAGRDSASEQSDGSREPDADGVEAYGRGESDTHDGLVIPASAGTVAQGGLESVRDVVGIRKSVPSLKVEQAEDVLFVEKRLLENGETGVLLTNGTGTGKTFSGLGVVKRALDRGERHVIIVAPSDKVVNDWIDTAKAFFGITDIAQLDGIKDNSPANRVVVTTYANFGQNMELVRRPWGLVVTDEAHYLSQAKDGTSTLAQKSFKGLTWHHKDGVFNRVSMEMADELAEMSSISASIDSNTRLMNRDDTMDQMYRALRDENEALERRRATLNEKVQARRAELEKVAAGMKKQDRPKALLLSATPFAYHFSLDYAEGYLFEHGEEPTSNRYNTPSARSRFFMENFGYRMRYNKLTQPENAAATGILERMFSERLKREGSMRGRMLAVPFDYSRDFVLAESMIGTKIDEIFDLVMSDKRFDSLRDSMEIGDYLARRYLLEGLKAKEAVKRIKAHLALGRKVVVFHDYKKGGATNPLRMVRGDQDSLRAYDELRAEVPGFDNLVAILDNLRSPIDVIRSEFPDAGIFNGDVPKLKRRQIVTEFNRSGSEMNVILGQRASAKEGISLHDTDGKYQRVFIDLGIPGRPTDAIQSEGRIIRLGMQSNGIIEYLTTGTNFERYTFAQTIATRASTAENLAMGENARALLQAFSTGYNDAQAIRPSAEQGVGGKKADAARESGDPFENAVALYYTNQKKTSKNKAAEGIDYFATPEPLGFKMVEWAGIRPGERVLEPSGGHGAIARFFPDSTTRHAVEPSYELAGRLALNSPDTKIHQVPFEDYDIINKFDAIVMNPPFGTAGKTAMDHLEKAVRHLKAGGRLVALIPNGSSMAKRFEKWYENVDGMFLAAEIQLPSVTFERAGTSVSARIVILDKVKAEDAKQQVSRDFTSAATAKEFFERLKNSSIPDRPAPTVEKTPAEMMSELLNSGRDAVIPEDKPAGIDGAFSAADFIHTRNGNTVFVARIDKKLSESEYAAAKSLAKKHGGYYQSYNKGGAIPGFHFPDADSRDWFLGAAGVQDSGLRASLLPSTDSEYLAAVKSGDMETAQRMVDEAAKKAGWSGDVMYHTTGANEPFTEFKYAALTGGEDRYRVGGHKAALTFTLEGLGAGWFTSNGSQFSGWRNSDASNVVRAYVNLKQPLTIEADPFAQRAFVEKKKELADIRSTIKAVQNQETFISQPEFKRIREREKELSRDVDFSKFDEDQVIKLSEQLNETYTKKGIKELEKKIKSLSERTGSREEILKRRRELKYADPFYGLMSLSETAQQEYQELIPGAAVRAALKAQGYDGIILQGTNADTSMGDTTLATWVIPFDGGATIKSAAPVTHDANGNVIPLSQRFDSSKESILYASPLPEAEPIATFKKRVTVDPALAANSREQQQAFGKNVASGKLASFGNKRSRLEQDIVDAEYEFKKVRKTNEDAMIVAKKRLEASRDEVEAKLFKAALGEDVAMDAADEMAFRYLINERSEQAGNDEAKHAENMKLRMALRMERAEIARRMQIGYDRTMTPAERAQEAITDAIYTPSRKIEKYAEKLTGAKKQAFLDKAAKDRIAEVEKALKKLGLDLAKVTGKNRDLQLENSRLMKEVLKTKNVLEQNIVRMVQKGASLADIKRRFGALGFEQAQEVITKAREELFSKIDAMAKSGMSREQIREAMKDGLKAAPLPTSGGMSADEIWKMIEEDFGLPKEIPATNLPTARPKKPKAEKIVETNPLTSDWSRPEFTDGMNSYTFDTKDREGIMERVEVIRGLAGALGKIDGLTGDKRTQAEAKLAEINGILAKYGTDAAGIFEAAKGIEDYGFDINDVAQVAAVSRAISMIDADIVDKASEWLYFSMLSGLQTMMVNATAVVPAAWETTVGRGFETALNFFVRDPMSAQLGESKYILKAIAPALTRAMSNARTSFAAQHPMFDRDVLAMEVDWERVMGGKGYRTGGSISGKWGDRIRIPMRILAATDDFNTTLMACVEVGTFAYRIAKAKGMKDGSPEMDRFIRIEVNTPGSFSYHLATQKAKSAIFSNPLPGQHDPVSGGKVPVNDLGDAVGYLAGKITETFAKEHDNLFVKTVFAAMRISFFPFQRTPFNILRKGVRYTLNPFSVFDIALGIVNNSRTADGQWQWNARGRNPELVRRAAMQLQGAMLMMLVAGLGEGDDDDQDKPVIITGSAPFSPRGQAERETGMRSGLGPYRISFRRKDGSERFGFNYGRLEPLATTLAASIDLVKSAKRSLRSGGDATDAASAALGGFVAQAQDKSFLKGMGDLTALVTNALAEPDLKDNRKFQQFLAGRVAMVMPNIIKQPIREADSQFRERSTGFMQELLYQTIPYGQKPAKVDPYGRPVEKTGNPVGRTVDVTDAGTNTVHPVDSMLLRFRDKHPDKAWFPSVITNAEFKHPKTGQNVKMNGDQLAEFRAQSGKMLSMALRSQSINYENPSELDVEKVKEAVSKARSVAKQALSHKFARQ